MKYIIDVPDTQEITYNTKYKMVSLKVNEGIVASEIYIAAEPYTEPDGCDGCKYTDTEEWEEPCRRCKNSYKLMWRAKG